ncbi:MAG: hypothetical protein ACP5HZ_02005 [Ferrimicrobium sp.]
MTSMEIASLLEEPQVPEVGQEETRHRRPRLLFVVVGVVLLVGLGVGAYFVLAGHPPSTNTAVADTQHPSVPSSETGRSAPAPVVAHAAASAPVPSSEYFTVKNPFVPKMIQTGPGSSTLPSG